MSRLSDSVLDVVPVMPVVVLDDLAHAVPSRAPWSPAACPRSS